MESQKSGIRIMIYYNKTHTFHDLPYPDMQIQIFDVSSNRITLRLIHAKRVVFKLDYETMYREDRLPVFLNPENPDLLYHECLFKIQYVLRYTPSYVECRETLRSLISFFSQPDSINLHHLSMCMEKFGMPTSYQEIDLSQTKAYYSS